MDIQVPAEVIFLRGEIDKMKEQMALDDATRGGMQLKIKDLGDKRAALMKETRKLTAELKVERYFTMKIIYPFYCF